MVFDKNDGDDFTQCFNPNVFFGTIMGT
jgi:hypothetical protein